MCLSACCLCPSVQTPVSNPIQKIISRKNHPLDISQGVFFLIHIDCMKQNAMKASVLAENKKCKFDMQGNKK